MKCSQCNFTQTYVRLKTKERVCRSCGFIEKIGIEENRVIKPINKSKNILNKYIEDKI